MGSENYSHHPTVSPTGPTQWNPLRTLWVWQKCPYKCHFGVWREYRTYLSSHVLMHICMSERMHKHAHTPPSHRRPRQSTVPRCAPHPLPPLPHVCPSSVMNTTTALPLTKNIIIIIEHDRSSSSSQSIMITTETTTLLQF